MSRMMQPHTVPMADSIVVMPLPSVRLYMVWGGDKIRSLVRYHHNMLRLSSIEAIVPYEDEGFETLTRKAGDLFVEMLSKGKFSPASYPFASAAVHRLYRDFDETKREMWLEMYKKAVKDMNMPSECIEDFWNWVEALSLRMLNRNGRGEVKRFPYASVWTDFVEFTQLYRCGRI